MTTRKTASSIDIIVPVYNEEDVLERFHTLLTQVLERLPYRFHIFYINDGSSDRTQQILENLANAHPAVTVVELSRNFGHQAALSAGLDLATGDAVITMDGDGQHPPACLVPMLDAYQQGWDVVLMQRTGRQGATRFKLWSASVFYRMLRRVSGLPIVPGAADFRLLRRNVVLALRQMPERHRFLRAMIAWAGFRTIVLPYELGERLGGQPKYTFRKMSRLAIEAIFSFSILPLWFNALAGLCLLLTALLLTLSNFVGPLSSAQIQSNLAARGSIPAMFCIGGMILLGLSLLGAYIGYTFQEVKHRPAYIIRSVLTSSAGPRESLDQAGDSQRDSK